MTHRDISMACVSVERRGHSGIILTRDERWLQVNVRVIEQLPRGSHQAEGVGETAVWVAEKNCVVDQLHGVKAIGLPFLVNVHGKVSISITPGYVGEQCKVAMGRGEGGEREGGKGEGGAREKERGEGDREMYQ